MVQMIGVIAILLAVFGLAVYAWLEWGKTSTAGQSTVGKYITAALESAQLTTNLGAVEVLSHIDVIEASPAATAACDVIADVLWSAAKESWKAAQSGPAVVSVASPVASTADIAALQAQIDALKAKTPTVTVV